MKDARGGLILELLRKSDGLIVLGDPGSGKTTFLKYLALTVAAGEGDALGLGQRLPILVPLSAYANALADADIRLDDFIAGYFHKLGANLPIGATTAVCTYREGASPCGALDMGGNVWESTLLPYSKQERSPVLRGGSWLSSQRNARCAYRDWYVSDDFIGNVGFRVVVCLANSDF